MVKSLSSILRYIVIFPNWSYIVEMEENCTTGFSYMQLQRKFVVKPGD